MYTSTAFRSRPPTIIFVRSDSPLGRVSGVVGLSLSLYRVPLLPKGCPPVLGRCLARRHINEGAGQSNERARGESGLLDHKPSQAPLG